MIKQKIWRASEELIKFIEDYATKYGYTFTAVLTQIAWEWYEKQKGDKKNE